MQPVGKAIQYFLSPEISSQSPSSSTVKTKLPNFTNQRGTRIYTESPFRWLLEEPTEETWLCPWFWPGRRGRDRFKIKNKNKNTEYIILTCRKWKSEEKWVHSITISHSKRHWKNSPLPNQYYLVPLLSWWVLLMEKQMGLGFSFPDLSVKLVYGPSWLHKIIVNKKWIIPRKDL